MVPASRNAAMTDTGSVAAISAPKRCAVVQSYPASHCMPAEVAIRKATPPSEAGIVTTIISLRSDTHGIWIEASKTRWGRKNVNGMCLVRGRPDPTELIASANPARTSPTE